MSSPNRTGSTPPFIKNEPEHHRPNPANAQAPEPMNLIVMMIAWGILTIALVAGAKVLWDILTVGMESPNGLWASAIALVISFAVGWVVSMVSIRSFHNIILPNVIRLYALFITLAIVGVYLRVVSKLFTETFDPTKHYLRYSIVLAGLFFVLMALHWLLENHNVFPYAFLILMAGVPHIVAIVVHYVFMPNGDPKFVGGDIYFLIFNLITAGLIALVFPRLGGARRSEM